MFIITEIPNFNRDRLGRALTENELVKCKEWVGANRISDIPENAVTAVHELYRVLEETVEALT